MGTHIPVYEVSDGELVAMDDTLIPEPSKNEWDAEDFICVWNS